MGTFLPLPVVAGASIRIDIHIYVVSGAFYQGGTTTASIMTLMCSAAGPQRGISKLENRRLGVARRNGAHMEALLSKPACL